MQVVGLRSATIKCRLESCAGPGDWQPSAAHAAGGAPRPKLYREPVEAREDGSGRPAAFRWRGRWYKVESVALVRPGIYNTWEPDRWRVFTRDGGVFELARDKDKKWMLWRVWD